MREHRLCHRFSAELIGTFGLVLGGCGTAVFAGLSVGSLGIALAFGLTVLCFAYAFMPISGAHFNPAVTIGVWAAGRMNTCSVAVYIVAQVVGALLAALVIWALVKGSVHPDIGTFAANGYGAHSPGGYGMKAAFLAEALLTFLFLIVILGVTGHDARFLAVAPLAIGLMLTLIHLISIPITNTSVNPARSLSQAVFVGGWALQQLWLFIVAPLIGGAVAGLFYRCCLGGGCCKGACPSCGESKEACSCGKACKA